MLGQDIFLVQLPPQTGLVGVRYNWWAETVPAHNTEVIIAASNAFLIIFLSMLISLSITG